jgi:hypothetical protein
MYRQLNYKYFECIELKTNTEEIKFKYNFIYFLFSLNLNLNHLLKNKIKQNLQILFEISYNIQLLRVKTIILCVLFYS